MRIHLTLIAAVLACFAALSAHAETTVLRHKNWTVSVGQFDDGSPFCNASGFSSEGSLNLVAIPYDGVVLHIFLPDANFGSEGWFEDIYLQVDARKPWVFYDAEFVDTSIFFQFPDDRQTTRFLDQLWQGRNLYLLNASGERIWSYSLAGSAAALAELGECKTYFE